MRNFLLLVAGLFLFATQAFSQTRTITGTVTDESGNPVANASILVKGTDIGTTTNGTGKFELNVLPNANIVVISAVGMAEKEFSIKNLTTLNVILPPSNAILDEVVVTGYGTQVKNRFTGAASKVEAKKIEQIPMPSIDQILQGRVAGFYIASGSGQPGSTNTRTNIRGVGSISGGNDPLYVVDGVPIESGVFRTLNPNDFESIDVLKDAAGSGLYGSRGANGVVVITTKKGKSGKPQIQYRGMYGFSDPPQQRNLIMMNTTQRLEYEEKILGPGGVLTASNGITGYPGWDYSPNNPRYQNLTASQKATEAALLDSIKNINTYWPSVFFRRGKFKQNEVNASGGNEKMTFFTSLSAYNQEGVVIRSNLDRYSFRANLDFKTDKLTVSVRSFAGWSSLSGIESEAGIALANPIAAAYLELPYKRLRQPGATDNFVGTGRIGANAYDRLFTTTSVSNQFKGNLGVTVQYNIWGGIGIRTTNGVDWRNTNASRFINPNSFAGRGAAPNNQGSYNEFNAENLQLISTTGLVFNKTYYDKHAVNAMAMMELIQNKYRDFQATGYGINLKLPNTPAAITSGTATNGFIPSIGGSKTINGLFSVFALVDYTYNNRYTISANIRRDAPSQVPEKNRNNIFWGAGGAWNIVKESFMLDQDIFSALRLRLSYGETANVAGFNSNFGYISTYGQNSYAGIPGIVPASPGNADYKLESQVISNIGLDANFLKNRIRTTIEFYNKVSNELFANQNLSRQTGFTSLSVNAGQVRNRGIEFQLGADLLATQDMLLTLNLNGAFNNNKILNLGGLTEIPAGTGIIRVGLPIGSHWVVGWAGVDPQTGAPIYLDSLGNKTPTFNAANNTANWSTYLPKFVGGGGLDFKFKGIDFGIFFTTAQGVMRYNNEKFFYETTNSNIQFNKRVEMLTQTWTTSGQNTDYQKINTQRQFTSKDILDASFVRLRNINVGYTFDKKLVRIFNSIRVWGQGQNLYTWTKWTGFDPEESNNIATYEFPNPKTITFGLDLNF